MEPKKQLPLKILFPLAGVVLLICMIAIAVVYQWKTPDTLKTVESSKILTVITDNNANAYYIYKEKPMGFEFDLAKAFADYLGSRLKIITPGWSNLFDALNRGEGDMIAAGVTVTSKRERIVDFSEPYLSIQQQAVIHKHNRDIDTLEDLNGRTAHVREHTSYHERLLELNRDYGMNIQISVHPDLPTENLIRWVAEKKIDITISDSNIALLNRRYYPDIRIAFPIREKQSLAWAVRKGDTEFLQKINRFIEQSKENGVFSKIYERYYAQVEIFDYVDLKKFHQRVQTRLPDYIDIIKRESAKHAFDWRLIAAVIYQESHFDPRAKSYTGVRGLMQLTRPTAREMGVTNRLDPEQSIRGGVKYLNMLYKRFDSIPNPRDRMFFALAGYNIGYGHVRDAQKIARQKGMDPKRWKSINKTLPLLSRRAYYKHTKYGYARGEEPVRYIRRIKMYYDILRRKALPGNRVGKGGHGNRLISGQPFCEIRILKSDKIHSGSCSNPYFMKTG